MIFSFQCDCCQNKIDNVFVWDKSDLTETEKERLTCCGHVMRAFVDYSDGHAPIVKGSNHLEKTRDIALKRSQEWDKKELPEIKKAQIKQKFFNE